MHCEFTAYVPVCHERHSIQLNDGCIQFISFINLHILKLTRREPDYMATEILPKLFGKTISNDINERHGTVLAIGEIVTMLNQIDAENGTKRIDDSIIDKLSNLVSSFQQRNQFKGMSGEMMFQCCCDFIRNCSSAKIAVTPDCIGKYCTLNALVTNFKILNILIFILQESWQLVIDSSVTKNSTPVRDAAIVALAALSNAYYCLEERTDRNTQLLNAYLKGAKEDLWEFVRIGYVSAIGVLPKFILEPNLSDVLTTLITHSLVPTDQQTFLRKVVFDGPAVANWSEARRDCVKALTNVIQTVGFDAIQNLELPGIGNADEKVFDCFLLALHEYTIDNRGDIGAWVREAAMNALYKLIVTMPHNLLTERKVRAVVGGLLQQAVEKIDRTRALAGKLFCKIIYK